MKSLRYFSRIFSTLVALIVCSRKSQAAPGFEVERDPPNISSRQLSSHSHLSPSSSSSSSHHASKHSKTHVHKSSSSTKSKSKTKSKSYSKLDSSEPDNIGATSGSSKDHNSRSKDTEDREKSRGKSISESKSESSLDTKEKRTEEVRSMKTPGTLSAQKFIDAVHLISSERKYGGQSTMNLRSTSGANEKMMFERTRLMLMDRMNQQSKRISSLLQDNIQNGTSVPTVGTNSTAPVTSELPEPPDGNHLAGFARKKDWFGSALCNETTQRDKTIDNTTASANEYYNLVDMLNLCWISSLKNPNGTDIPIYTRAIASEKNYYSVPFNYVNIHRIVYSDSACSEEVEESMYQDQLDDLLREYHQEYPEECRKSHMPFFDPIHANTVHSRIGDVIGHDQRDESIEYNQDIILKAHMSTEDCLNRKGHAVVSATVPNCIISPNQTSTRFVCNNDGGYNIYKYQGIKCKGKAVRQSYSVNDFCMNPLPVDAVLGFVSVTCPQVYSVGEEVPTGIIGSPAAATVHSLDTSSNNSRFDYDIVGNGTIANIYSIFGMGGNRKMSLYIQPPVDFKGFWNSDGGISAGGIGILGMIMFFASAFSFFRLKEGPTAVGVSDI